MVHYFKLQGHATFIPVFELILSDMVHCFKLQNQATFISSNILNHKIMHFVPIFWTNLIVGPDTFVELSQYDRKQSNEASSSYSKFTTNLCEAVG